MRRTTSTSDRRGFERDPGGGLGGEPIPSDPISLNDIVKSRLWARMHTGNVYEFQSAIFQPVGGMDMIAKAFQREIGELITFNAKVTRIKQDARGVTATYVDAGKGGKAADRDRRLVRLHHPALGAVADRDQCRRADAGGDRCASYAPSIKIGLQFKRKVLGGGRAHPWRHHLYRPAESR